MRDLAARNSRTDAPKPDMQPQMSKIARARAIPKDGCLDMDKLAVAECPEFFLSKLSGRPDVMLFTDAMLHYGYREWQCIT